MVKLSIIVVSYNESEYIEEAIESCLNQELPFEYEIIIGDDGSDDGSLEIIQKYCYKYPNISYFVMDRSDTKDLIPSIRVSNVLKKGFGLAKGKYIATMSGDDLIIGKYRLRNQVYFLDNNSEYVSCYTDYVKFGEDFEEQECSLECSFSRSTIWALKYVHIACFVFRKSVTELLLDRFVDDTGMLFLLLKAGKLRHFSEVGYGYRQRAGSIMHESDSLELGILELMLYQDVLNCGGLGISSYSRFSRPLRLVYERRSELSKEKYKKYIKSCCLYENNVIDEISKENGGLSQLRFKLLISVLIHAIFKIVNVCECWAKKIEN